MVVLHFELPCCVLVCQTGSHMSLIYTKIPNESKRKIKVLTFYCLQPPVVFTVPVATAKRQLTHWLVIAGYIAIIPAGIFITNTDTNS